jgi:hypothetical protein
MVDYTDFVYLFAPPESYEASLLEFVDLFKQYGEPDAKINKKHYLNPERFYEILTRIMQEAISEQEAISDILENQIKTLKQRLIKNQIKLYTT